MDPTSGSLTEVDPVGKIAVRGAQCGHVVLCLIHHDDARVKTTEIP
jgi:type II secretory ATPase GspE/PulE/Tfp pilus assembly ATPase PilB-like protein